MRNPIALFGWPPKPVPMEVAMVELGDAAARFHAAVGGVLNSLRVEHFNGTGVEVDFVQEPAQAAAWLITAHEKLAMSPIEALMQGRHDDVVRAAIEDGLGLVASDESAAY